MPDEAERLTRQRTYFQKTAARRVGTGQLCFVVLSRWRLKNFHVSGTGKELKTLVLPAPPGLPVRSGQWRYCWMRVVRSP